MTDETITYRRTDLYEQVWKGERQPIPAFRNLAPHLVKFAGI